jgi:hypothetical protein
MENTDRLHTPEDAVAATYYIETKKILLKLPKN